MLPSNITIQHTTHGQNENHCENNLNELTAVSAVLQYSSCAETRGTLTNNINTNGTVATHLRCARIDIVRL